VSETALNAGYLPEEHAPDPMISHGDPSPPGKVGIWLFLASEIMFFVAILGSYIILRGGSHELFADHAMALSKPAAAINTLVLIFSSLTMALSVDAAQKGKPKLMAICLALTLACAGAFMGIKAYEYNDKAHHRTIVTHEMQEGASASAPTQVFVYDGHVLHEEANGDIAFEGLRVPLEKFANGSNGFDIHLVSEESLHRFLKAESGGPHKIVPEEYHLRASDIGTQITYGPWKNIFYACYFTLTGVHGLHVLGGMIPLSILLVQGLRGRIFPHHVEYVGLYWHFVDLVWIFLFPLLYLI
jgi:cytochrome c oxidase subunit 3